MKNSNENSSNWLTAIIGTVNWEAPVWMRRFRAWCSNHKWQVAAIVLMLIAGLSAYIFYQSLPKPLQLHAQITPPDISANVEDAKPNPLNIKFYYKQEDPKALNTTADQRLAIAPPSVARIDLVGKHLSEGIALGPSLPGTWQWLDDNQLQFQPSKEWPPGTEYTITLDKSLFADDPRLSSTQYKMRTPALEAHFSNSQFYQDPEDVSVRRAVASLSFSHPITKDEIQKYLRLEMRPSGKDIESKPQTQTFTLTLSKNNREAYIHSGAISLPDQTTYLSFILDKGVKSSLGGQATQEESRTKVEIPDRYSFLQVQSQSQIVRNDNDEPEQIISLEFTDDIAEAEIKEKLNLYLLPEKNANNQHASWRSAREVTDATLQNSQKLTIDALPNPRNFSKNYSFKIDVPENRQIYVKLDKGLSSVNDFVHASFYDNILYVPAYPKEVKIVGSGSVLSNLGSHKLSLLSRGLNDLHYRIGRVPLSQTYHLVSQTHGDISNPSFMNWSFGEDNLASFDEGDIHLMAKHPKDADYASLDLSPYLNSSEASEGSTNLKEQSQGLFFIEIWGYDKRTKSKIYQAYDKRLILLTDLGLIVKNNADSSHELFVQSLSTGEPVAGAEVELLGKNGVAVVSGKTDSSGHISIAKTTGLSQEKTPTVYIVKHKGDISFIPFDRYSRQINLSRFDIGGEYGFRGPNNSLKAFLFSDRGIYRPGEEVKLAAIIRDQKSNSVSGMPLELVIRNPRYQEVKVQRFTLPSMGFLDFNFSTELVSETGQYSAELFLVRDKQWRSTSIGRINFKVEEFQPDTMQIESQLEDVVKKGWNNTNKIQAKIKLNNLFGAPAQARKIKGHLKISPYNFNFREYSDYTFNNPFVDNENPLSLDTQLEDKQTNADGEAEFELDLSRFQQGTYLLNFSAEGFDQGGGRSVIASNQALISPVDTLVGYKANGKLDYIHSQSQRKLHFIAIAPSLELKSVSDFTLKIKEIQAISTLVKQSNGTFKYQSIEKEQQVSSQVITMPSEGYSYAIDTEKVGDFVVEIYDQDQKQLARVPYSVTGVANLQGKIDKNAELQLKLDKSDYKAGEFIEMQIKAPYKGSGLITIESDRVHKHLWFKADTESSVQRIGIPKDLEGNAYVNVTFVRDLESKEVFSNPLSYAVAPFSIDRSARELQITLKSPDIARPGKPMTIGFTSSKPAKVAIFAVDEGILQVANYASPNPLNFFFKKKALAVNTLQILDLLLPEYKLIQQVSAAGGGAMLKEMESSAIAKNLNPFQRKLDQPAVFWGGIVSANTTIKEIEFDIPDTFAGQLRIMAVAVSDTALGSQQTSTLVRGPFVISPNILSQAAPDDEFLATVGIANLIEGSGKNAKVEVSLSSTEGLELISQHQTTLAIDEGGEAAFTTRVKVKDILGPAELKITARYLSEKTSEKTTEEVATRSVGLSIRPASTYYSSLTSGFNQAGKVNIDLDRSLYEELAQQSVSASTSPLVLVDGLYDYLEHYPHGCTEQVVSQVFPLVGLSAHPAYSPHLKELNQHFDVLIQKLRERQTADGGFMFWPGHSQSALYPSIYVMHFLMESQAKGLPVPSDMMQRGKAYLKTIAAEQTSTLWQARDRATAIYILTRLGEVTTNYLVDLEESLINQDQKKWQQDLLSAYMAATYELLQKDQEAKRLIKYYRVGTDSEVTDDLHSQLSLDAQYIYLVSLHFEALAKSLKGNKIKSLTSRIFKGEYNTISSAYSILALGAYSERINSQELDRAIQISATNINGERQALKLETTPFKSAAYKTDTQKLEIDASSPLYYVNSQAGFNKYLPTKVIHDGIEIYRTFEDESGNTVSEAEQGQELWVKLKIRALNNRTLNNIAITDLLPGGFEVIRSSVNRTAVGWMADYVDVREDRLVFYGSFSNRIKELSYKVKLSAAGEFTVPPSYAESMYDRSIKAMSTASRFVVHDSE